MDSDRGGPIHAIRALGFTADEPLLVDEILRSIAAVAGRGRFGVAAAAGIVKASLDVDGALAAGIAAKTRADAECAMLPLGPSGVRAYRRDRRDNPLREFWVEMSRDAVSGRERVLLEACFMAGFSRLGGDFREERASATRELRQILDMLGLSRSNATARVDKK